MQLEIVDKGFEILQQCFARAGKDYRAGSSMPHYFQRASIGEHDGILFSCKSTPALKGQDMLFAVLKSLKMPAVKLGLKTEGEYDTFLNTLAASVPSTDSVMRRPDMISVWRKRAN